MANLKIGRADTTHDTPAHTPGIAQGNSRGSYEKQEGHKRDGRSTAERSTGINAKHQSPIDPRMPNLSPA